jgi:hypothetical protein
MANDGRRMALIALLAGAAAAAALIVSWNDPAPFDETRLADLFAEASKTPDAALDLTPLARKVCFVARGDRALDEARRFGAKDLIGDPPADPARPVVIVFTGAERARLLAPEPRRLDWDRTEGGGAFCAGAAKAAPTTSGGIFLTEFLDVAVPAGGDGPQG